MRYHGECRYNCGSTDCTAPARPYRPYTKEERKKIAINLIKQQPFFGDKDWDWKFV